VNVACLLVKMGGRSGGTTSRKLICCEQTWAGKPITAGSMRLDRSYLGVSTNSRPSYADYNSNEQSGSPSCSGCLATSPNASDCNTLDKLKLTFSKNELTSYTDQRAVGLDQKSISALQHLRKQQCIAVGKITSQYPLFLEIQPQMGAVMGGETRKLLS